MTVQKVKHLSPRKMLSVIAVAAVIGSCATLTGGLRVGGSERGTVQAGAPNRHELKIIEAGTIVIDVISENENFDPMVELLNGAGNSMGSNDDGGERLNAKLRVQVSPGAYVIIVRGYGGSTGPYRIVVSREGEGPVGDSQAALKDKGSIHPGDTKTGSIAPYESHFYSFQTGAKNMLLIDGKKAQGSGFDPFLLLMNESGGMIKQDDDSGGNLNARIQTFVPEGRYKVVIKGFGNTSGDYELTLKEIEIKQLGIGQAMTGSLQSGEKHYYSLMIKEKGLYDIKSERGEKSALDPFVSVAGESGMVMYKDDDSGGDINAKVTCYLTEGGYLVAAEGSDSAPGTYRITAEKSTINPQPHTSIALGQTRTGWLIPEARHIYTMQIEKDTLVILEHRRADGSSLDPFLTLENGEGELITRDESGGGTRTVSLIISNLKKGGYRIIASGFGASNGQYKLSARTEVGKKIAAGQTADGTIGSGEFEIYRFSVKGDAMFSINMNRPGGSNLDPFLTLMNGKGKVIARDDDSGGNLNSRIISFFNKGDYFIMASGLGSSSGAYSLSVKSMEARKIGVGETKTGSLSPGGQDIYSFTMKKGGLVTIDAEKHGNSALDPILTLKSKTGTTIAEDDDGGGNLNARISRVLAEGTYAIIVHGYGGGAGEYLLKLGVNDEVQSVNRSITLGQTVTGTISRPEQRDRYNFSVKSFTGVVLRAKKTTGSMIDPFLELLDSGGATIITDDDGARDRNAIISRHLGPGQYTVVVKGFGGTTGKYLLSTMEVEEQK